MSKRILDFLPVAALSATALIIGCNAEKEADGAAKSPQQDNIPAIQAVAAAIPGSAILSDTVSDPMRAKIRAQCMEMRELSRSFSEVMRVQPGKVEGEAPLPLSDSAKAAGESIKKDWLRLQDSASLAIKDYKKSMSEGAAIPGILPVILLNAPLEDSLSLAKLPAIKPSSFLAGHPFFFMGAGPFLRKSWKEGDATVHRDLRGDKELRFCNETSANTTRAMRLIRGQGVPAKTIDGGAIPSGHYEEDSPFEKSVKGIGSMTHVLEKDFRVFFITDMGMASGRLVQVTDQLFDANQGCVSDLPEVCFGAPETPPGEILGVFIPYAPLDIASCSVSRDGDVWTVDITGDGAPEFSGVSSTYEGASGAINHIIWYGNVSGKWQPIDSATDFDCT